MAKVCQSCSMPMRLDEHGGTEADGSHSVDYCSMCYEGGAFIQPGMSLQEMQGLVYGVLRKKHLPRFMARSAVKKIAGLERWA